MFATRPRTADLSEAWIEGEEGARWRSAPAHGGDASGSSVLEIDPRCRLPRHTDSAEEVVVVTAGKAAIAVGEEVAEIGPGGIALVPECVPHEVRNAGDEVLRFVAVYASSDVTTTYEDEVQPDGGRERDPLP